MAPTFVPIEQYKTKLYQREKEFKNFTELSEEQLSALAKKVYRNQEIIDDSKSYHIKRISKLERYQKALQYLTNQYIYSELRTFDERIAFLIMLIDPNLVIFKEFLKIDLMSITDIAKIESKRERNRLYERRNEILANYESTVREKIGFFDAKLLKYEKLFFMRFFSEKELITEIGINNQDNLMIKAKSIKDLNSISDKRYEQLVSIAQTWLSLAPTEYNCSVAAYNVTEQKKLLGLSSLAEQLTLFILIIDGDLEMLKIYEEESMLKNVEERIIQQFGYFNQELLVLERKFHTRFCPDKQLSFWSK